MDEFNLRIRCWEALAIPILSILLAAKHWPRIRGEDGNLRSILAQARKEKAVRPSIEVEGIHDLRGHTAHLSKNKQT